MGKPTQIVVLIKNMYTLCGLSRIL